MALETGLAGKTVIVTGASRGIGEATALAIASEGANVVLSSRKQDSLDQVAARIRKAVPAAQVLAKAAHAASAEQATECVEAAVAEFGQVDVLINNAGTSPYFGPLTDLDEARARKTVEVNQFGPILWTQACWKASMAERGGTVVNVASVGGLVTEPGIGYYNATKAALLHITRQLAMELAPRVRVNAVAPGIVKTHLAKALWENNEEALNRALPLGRVGEVADIAKAILFLAGDTSTWMTGQSLVVDGGAMVRANIS